ncbi:hypothetical protein PVAND_015943 [Polypedilum vanderplanki]|uniref:Cuticle protein n=1 Tax=Polypedilum vanderplanki TaxID=319348 RepID=A0A9J6BE60_POLVA|nr:hypothetical protein PVAND_015943 [Polypedilum vanderplanki]
MKTFVIIFVLTVLVAYNSAVPANKRDIGIVLQQAKNDAEATTVIYGNNIPGHEAEILHQEFNKDDHGNYNFAYKQSDLQQREETGTVVKDEETGNYTLDNVVGSYEYIRPDGKKQRVEYTADKEGFKPNIIVTDA